MEKQMNIPKLRFPDFDAEWIKNSGDMLFASISDKNHHSDLPILAITQDFGAVPRNLIDFNISVTDKSISTYKVVQKGDYIISLRSFQGGIEYSDYKGICSPAYIILRPKTRLERKFFKVYFKTERYITLLNKNIEGIRDGKMISYKYFSEVLLNTPTLPEQKKIASFFTTIDQKISQLKQKKTLIENYKRGLMQKIFSQQIRFKDDDGREFPKWQKKKLGEVSYVVNKRNKNKLQLPVYSINNKEGFLPQADQFDGMDSNGRGYEIGLYKIIDKQTFAYNPARINVGSIGYSNQLSNIIISSLYVCFKTTELLNDFFLLQYFQTYNFNRSVLTNVEGGVREYLFYDNFSKINIDIPSLPEQIKIANFLSSIDAKVNHTNKQIEKVEAWKKGLLQQMFV